MAKEKKKELDKIKSIEATRENAAQMTKRTQSYSEIVKALCDSSEPIKTVLSTIKSDSLKLTYQYIGGVLSKLPNLKKETFICVLENHPSITMIDRSDQSKLVPAESGFNNDSVAIEGVSVVMV